MKRLPLGEHVSAVCALVLLALSPTTLWATYKVETFGVSLPPKGASAFDPDVFGPWSKLAMGFALLALVVFILRATSGSPSRAWMLYAGFGGGCFLCLVITLIVGPLDIRSAFQAGLPIDIELEELEELVGLSIEAGRGIMLYIGTLLAAGIAAGGFMMKGADPMADTAPPAAPPA